MRCGDRQVADQASWDAGPSGTTATVSFRLGPPAPFRVAQRLQDGCAILAVTGQLDLGSAGQFADAAGDLIAATPGLRLILDLSGLTMWDSSGLTALIAVQRRISGSAARMVLAGARPPRPAPARGRRGQPVHPGRHKR